MATSKVKKAPVKAAPKDDDEEQGMPIGQQAQGGLQTMDDDDVNKYMEELLKAQNPDLEGLEAQALGNFKAISNEINKQQQLLTVRQQEVEQLTDKIKREQGQLDAYVNLLVAAEDARRTAAATED